MDADNDNDEPTPVVRDRSPVVWEDRPFSPANEPPGWWEHRRAQHPFLAGLVVGIPWLVWWLLVTPLGRWPWLTWFGIAWWLVGGPLLEVWLWREGGARRRGYDRRVRVSEGGAATLDG